MLKRIIHVNSNIFFPDPKIYIKQDRNGPCNIHRILYRSIRNTWGFTESMSEFKSLHNNAYEQIWTRYFCFSNDLDIMQFMLLVGDNSHRAYIWPKGIKFTIHEYIEETSNT